MFQGGEEEGFHVPDGALMPPPHGWKVLIPEGGSMPLFFSRPCPYPHTSQEDGVIHKGGLIAAVAHSAIARARGMDNVNGLNGGLTPEMGEMSTADYSKKLNR